MGAPARNRGSRIHNNTVGDFVTFTTKIEIHYIPHRRIRRQHLFNQAVPTCIEHGPCCVCEGWLQYFYCVSVKAAQEVCMNRSTSTLASSPIYCISTVLGKCFNCLGSQKVQPLMRIAEEQLRHLAKSGCWCFNESSIAADETSVQVITEMDECFNSGHIKIQCK